MTVAICIRCGVTKHGALTPCHKCGFVPQLNEDKAKAMIVTDHFLSKSDLEQFGERIKSGKPVQYPAKVVQQYVDLFEKNPHLEKEATRFMAGCVLRLLFVAVVIGFVVWLALR